MGRPLADDQSLARVPRIVAGCEIRSLPIDHVEAFILSRIDGAISEADLVSLTGFDEARVRAALELLVHLNAITLDAPLAPRRSPFPPYSGFSSSSNSSRSSSPDLRTDLQSPRPPPAAAVSSPFPAAAPAPSGPAAVTSAPDPASTTPPSSADRDLYDPRELDEPVDIDLAKRRQILGMYYRLEQLDHYALLGVSTAADRKEIKASYYALAAVYHPDRYFRKVLGSFKFKMEAVFARLTVALETLTSSEARGEYDTYLATQRRNEAMEQQLRGEAPVPHLTSVPGTDPPVVTGTPFLSAPRSSPPIVPASPLTQSTPTSPPATSSASQLRMTPPPRPPDQERLRREVLARKLGGARASLPPAHTSAPFVRKPEGQRSAVEELQRRREAAVAGAQRGQSHRYAEAARQAMADNDPASAANAYRLAISLEPNNPELIALHRTAATAAASLLADGYLKQADYEARAEHWKEAARSYVRAAAGRPDDVSVLQRAAQALLKGGGDLHQAADFARKAIQLTPGRIDARIILAEVYLTAGMNLAAKKELDAASELAPHDDRITVVLKKLK